MTKPLKLHDVDEFAAVISIPNEAISDVIVGNIRHLDEKKELEPFIQEILFDPNETPHGPTEIADILTCHVHIKGEAVLTAVVLKGKAWGKVRSKDVAHQFAKLRQVPQLGLIVLGAVGNLQDDAVRDFVQTAVDAKTDYLIADAHELARLLIAHDKICPKDGLPFDNEGTCTNGHVLDEGLSLEMKVREEPQVTILSQRDVSHSGAKRYSVNVLLDKHYPRDVIRSVVSQITQEIRESQYYRHDRVESHFGKKPADVVWLHIASALEDISNANWICQTSWIDPDLSESMRPHPLQSDELVDGIAIKWNENHEMYRQLFSPAHRARKEDVVDPNMRIKGELEKLAAVAMSGFAAYESGEITEAELAKRIQELESRATELYLESGNIPYGPPDCHDFAQRCQELFATIHNIFLYYSERGMATWETRNRDYLMSQTIKSYYEDLSNVEYEERKMH
jgi:hypothetical protein